MDKHLSQFDPQGVDEQIAQMRQQTGSSTSEANLIDDLYDLHGEDLQIRDRVWVRLNRDVAREQRSSTGQEEDQPNRAEYQKTIISREERKTVEENTSSWGINPRAHLAESKKRRSPMLSVVSIGLIAAVVLITIVSFTLFSSVLRSAPQAANRTSTITGAQNHQQQPQLPKVISSGKQVCSLNAGSKISINGAPWSAGVNWSAQGQLVVATYSTFKAYATKDCTPTTSFKPAITQVVGPLWSPDGSKLFVVDAKDYSKYVLDRNGKILTKLNNDDFRHWSSNSDQILFTQGNGTQNSQPVDTSSQLAKIKVSIKAVDVNHGNKITTLTQLPEGYGIVGWSSNVKKVVVYTRKNDTMIDFATWDTDQGKIVSTTATSLPDPSLSLGQELSPDGSLLALNRQDNIEIYSTDTWKLLASFVDKKGSNQGASLAWSPDGKYLAEVSQSIKIYDVAAKKLATMFGQVDAQHEITDLAWSPDGTGIATSMMVLSNDQPSALTVNVWALS